MCACRVANLGQDGSIDAGRINLQYWFNGPSDIPDAADPLSQFTMNCLDTTTSECCNQLLSNDTMHATEGCHTLGIGKASSENLDLRSLLVQRVET